LQINDLAYEAVKDPATGQLMFNVVVGGYFSLKRNIMSVPLGVALTEDQVIPFTLATLRVFR
jgi:ferredoxin-nitrite reductase